MSKIQADSIATRDGSLSTKMSNAIHGSAKAWVNFDGTGTVAIRRAFNVSSIVDNGTGDYLVYFGAALPDVNFGSSVSCDNAASYGRVYDIRASRTTWRIRLQYVSEVGTLTDCSQINVVIFR